MKVGVDLEVRNAEEETPLIVAAQAGHLGAVKALLAAGADVGAINEDGDQALHLAAYAGQVEVVSVLLGKHAYINAIGSDDETPLIMAIRRKHEAVVKLLLVRGAAIALPVSLTLEQNFDEVFDSALMFAVHAGSIPIVQILLEHNADLDARGSNGATSLMVAVCKNNIEMVNFLLKNNASADRSDNNGYTVLMCAAEYADVKMVRALLRHQPDLAIDAKDSEGMTALQMAVSGDDLDIVTELLLCGADVNITDKGGMSALLYVEEQSAPDVIYKLLSQPEIIMNTPNDYGETVLKSFVNRAPLQKQARHMGALEYRAIPRVRDSSQSIHDAATEASVNATIQRLMAGKEKETILKGYRTFCNYLSGALFDQDIREIAKEPFGSEALKTLLAAKSVQQRVQFLKEKIQGDGQQLGYVAKIMHPDNSEATKKQFTNVAGLVWLAITDAQHLYALSGIANPTEARKNAVFKDVRHTLCKGMVSICCEYLKADNPRRRDYAACATGAVNHHLAILNGIHDQVKVSNEPLAPQFSAAQALTLKESLLNNGYAGLENVLQEALKGRRKCLQSIVEGLAFEGCTQAIYVSFLENTNEYPRTPALQRTLERLLGILKTVFEPTTVEGYIALEDALMEVPYVALISMLNNLLPRQLAEQKLLQVMTAKEVGVAILHAYIAEQLQRLDQQLWLAPVENVPSIGERMAQLKLKKYHLPPAKGDAPEGTHVENLEALLQADENRGLVDDALWDPFRTEPALAECFPKQSLKRRNSSPVSFSAPVPAPLAGSASMRAARLATFEGRAKHSRTMTT